MVENTIQHSTSDTDTEIVQDDTTGSTPIETPHTTLLEPDSQKDQPHLENRKKTLKERYLNTRFASVIVVSIGFMIVLGGYNGSQSYIPIIHGDFGFYILVIFYFIYSLSTFLAPIIIDLIGSAWTQILATVPFAIVVALVGVPYWWLSVIGAFLGGLGCGIYWVANGAFLNSIAGDEIGLFSGIFFSILMTNVIFGNFLTGVLFSLNLENWIVFLIMALIVISGTLFLLILIPLKTGRRTSKERQSPKKFLNSIKKTFSLLLTKEQVFLLPLYFYNGYSIAFFYGNMPAIIGKEYAGFVMSVFGASEFITSIIVGKLSDVIGVRISLTIGMFFQALGLALTFFFHLWKPYMYFITAIILGIGDISLNTLVYPTITNTFKEENVTDGFAVYRFIQAMSTSIGMFIPIVISLTGFQISLFVFLIFGMLSYYFLEFFILKSPKIIGVQKVEKKEENFTEKDVELNVENIEN